MLALARALTGLGHQVDLLTFPQGDEVAVRGLRHRRSLRVPFVGRVRAGASLAKLVLDVPFMLEAWARMALGGYDVVHGVEEAAHLAAPLARLLGLPLVVDVDSSIPDQLRYSGFARRGPLPALAARLEAFASPTRPPWSRSAPASARACGGRPPEPGFSRSRIRPWWIRAPSSRQSR